MTKVIVWLISKIASSDFNGGAYEQGDLLPLFYPRDPRNLVFHLKFKSTAALLMGSPRSDFVWWGGGTQQHPQVPTLREQSPDQIKTRRPG